MRILAIRGKNIASLADAFEISFGREPLASAGVFAISGQTGAGKSALLDALCVALYNKTPRLFAARHRGVSLPDVGDETVSQGDPRTLLRRGAAEGWAEADFVGNDGIEYRARWATRRARGKATGKLQAAEMSLVRVDNGAPIADGLTDVLCEIQRRVGLTFEQFTRAVLLAQNEFSAFLRSDDNDRASLLETLTATNVFSTISRRVYSRAQAEREKVIRLTGVLAGEKPLEEDERRAVQQQRDIVRDSVESVEAKIGQLEAHLRWHDSLADLLRAEGEAHRDLTRADFAVKTAYARREYLRMVDEAQTARPILVEHDRLLADVKTARGRLETASKQLEKSEVAIGRAKADRIAAEASLDAAEKARSAAAADLDTAKALDAQIEALAPGLAEAEKARAEAAMKLAKAREDVAGNRERHQSLTLKLDEVKGWLSEHSDLRLLGEQWHRWDMLLAHAVKAEAEAADALRNATVAQKAEQDLSEVVRKTDADLTEAQQDLKTREDEAADAAAGVSAFDPESLAAGRVASEARRDQLSEAQERWNTLSRVKALVRDLDHSIVRGREGLDEAAQRLARCGEERAGTVAAYEEAGRALTDSHAACAENVERLRQALRPDAPCPVCGSTDHPYATAEASLRSLLMALQERADRLAAERDRMIKEEAALTERVDSFKAKVAEDTSALAEAQAEAARATEAWQALAVSTEVRELVPEEMATWISSSLQSAKTVLGAIVEQEAAHRKALSAQEAARKKLDAARTKAGSIRERVDAQRSDLERATHDFAAAQDKADEAQRRRDDLLTELDGAFPDHGWRTAWQEDPAGFHRCRAAEVKDWNATSATQAELREKIDRLDEGLNGLTAAKLEAQERHDRVAAELDKSTQELEEKRLRRGLLFGGRSVKEVQTELDDAVRAARNAETDRTARLNDATGARAGALEAWTQAQRLHDDRKEQTSLASAALQQWIDRFNETHESSQSLDLDRLRELLARPQEWISHEREALKKLDDDLRSATAVLSERRGRRETHEAARPTSTTADEVRKATAGARADLERKRADLTDLQATLRADDARRQRAEALGEELRERQAAERVWAQLSELIGSADGKKFRNYAQQLTLQVLLGYANSHLADLSRRYRLDRIPDTLALVVLDHDMGDEVRSVHSLSGGESFLVSLALALGLASLSSGRVRVESLFIDEGFGSLDADTLRIAMDALDNLQAYGRKVGVISHVEEMTERIGTRVHVVKLPGGRSKVVVGAG